ncbi:MULTISPECIES: hypothetical protein [Burkholderia]|uniref:hypothetical protein n=1 Tax=Burkholderia TaxID=32008 RepID=UPI00214FAF74|nr:MULTISPECIES: hypothetical protein [Burkholderia]MDR5643250.1 hypothetical protein [Burkholderia cenocepacia]UVS97394.1 hypothetical protein EFP19_17680 [Burkholderia glumae]
MADPLDPINTEPTIIIQAEARFTRSTIANLNDAADRLVETKKSMLEDMSRNVFKTPDDALQAIMTLQNIQNQVTTLRDSMAQRTNEGFTPKDIETIEEMKRQGKSEEKIASLFGTNQTKINRLRNGKTPVDEG